MEQEFFDRYYHDEKYNSYGWKLRFERDRDNLMRLSHLHNHSLGHVLSLGCGDGLFECMIASNSTDILGIDVSPEAIKTAKFMATKERINNISFQTANFDKLKFYHKFDTIIALAFLHHLPAITFRKSLLKIQSWLRPGGMFYLQDPNSLGFLRVLGDKLFPNVVSHYHTSGERTLNPYQLQKSIESLGFCQATLSWIDLTLIPASFILTDSPNWPLTLCKKIDAVFCKSPLKQYSSGFNLSTFAI